MQNNDLKAVYSNAFMATNFMLEKNFTFYPIKMLLSLISNKDE